MTQSFSSVKFVIFFGSLATKYVKKSALIFDQVENKFFLSFNELDGLLFIATVVFSVCNLEFFQKIDSQKIFPSQISCISKNLPNCHIANVPVICLLFTPAFILKINPYVVAWKLKKIARIAAVIVGHVPLHILRAIWFILEKGGTVTRKVFEE